MREVEVIVVGAGLAGLRALYGFREAGFETLVLEASDEIGGVWNHNRYPGARCDVESYDYSYSFSPELEQEWRWSERYPTQPEILRYIHHVADRFSLRSRVELGARVESAVYDEAAIAWTVRVQDGRAFLCRHLVLCLGQLSAPKLPSYPGQENFAGETIVSASWPRDRRHHFSGQRVGILGTGSSGMQMTPVVARTAAHVTVFQRTANYSVPAANAPLTDEEDRQVKANYAERRQLMRNSPTGLGFLPGKTKTLEAPAEEREAVFEAAYHRLGFGFALTYPDILLDEKANDVATDFLKRKIAERVAEPALRDKLVPSTHRFATRRPSVDSGYFEAFSRPNVELADIKTEPITGITADGISTTAKHHRLDVLIYATGFDALTGSILKPDIRGRNGQSLRDKWREGPLTHLGVGTAGFPNMFIVAGPGSPSVLSNVMVSIEEQVDWFVQLLENLRDEGVDEIEVTEDAERDWTAHVQERARETLYMTADSFYNGGEIAGKPRVFMPYSGGVRHYRRLLQGSANDGYPGFALRKLGLAMKARAHG
ncbi:flavin-containing monooxygenase [Aquibium microcysteis]|uniref:flavin-containing monooxygenase n=1 Tax=Aquibium microcysteis TaxID=675281 RepID=UPI00165D21B9|nr:NAD(P)/FAD-dependent oxidoreductase [Aquibium microcysteis]